MKVQRARLLLLSPIDRAMRGAGEQIGAAAPTALVGWPGLRHAALQWRDGGVTVSLSQATTLHQS